MTAAELAALEALVRAAAQAELIPRFGHTLRQEKRDGSWVTEADLAMQSHLAAALAAKYPDIPLLGEEMSAAEQARLLAEAGGSDAGLWVLDPLDGTSNFAAGIPLFSVSLALLRHGRIEAGIVYDPVRDESFAALRGHGATLDGRPLRTPEAGVPLAKATACVDFKRLAPALGARLGSTPPYSSQRAIGTVALEWCWVAAGRFHVYLHGSTSSGTMRPVASCWRRRAAGPTRWTVGPHRSIWRRARPPVLPTRSCSDPGLNTCGRAER